MVDKKMTNLRAENERMREALNAIVSHDKMCREKILSCGTTFVEIARLTLEELEAEKIGGGGRMKIYQITVDSFCKSHSSYWTSLEAACKGLPKNKDFMEAVRVSNANVVNGLSQSKENVSAWMDCKEWERVDIILTLDKVSSGIRITMPGALIQREKVITTPAVMKPGEPYIPEKSERIHLEPIVRGDEPICFAYYYEIEVYGDSEQ